MNKVGRPKKQPILPTPDQESWLKENYNLYVRDYLAEKLGINRRLLQEWFKYLGLNIKARPIAKVIKEPKQIIRFKPVGKPPRVQADHTNMSREQRIDYWLNYPI
jgi:hypothetical protein